MWAWRWDTHWTVRPPTPGYPSKVYIKLDWPNWPEIWFTYPWGARECGHGWSGVWVAWMHGFDAYDYGLTPNDPTRRY